MHGATIKIEFMNFVQDSFCRCAYIHLQQGSSHKYLLERRLGWLRSWFGQSTKRSSCVNMRECIETSHRRHHHLRYYWNCNILSGETTLVKLVVVLIVMWTHSSTIRVFILLHVLPDLLLTSSVEHSPSWEANRSSASHEIPSVLWNLKLHYHIHTSLPPVPVLSQINPNHGLPHHFY